MRAGWPIESCTSNRSLMTGKVSTDESRKEIRNSPGAPSVPAKATIFDFHEFNLTFTPRSNSRPSEPPPSHSKTKSCHSERTEESAFFGQDSLEQRLHRLHNYVPNMV